MNNEYIIINETAIQKRIDEWEIELQECFKAPVGKFNSEYVSTLQQAIATARDFLSQSTPLIPEIEKAFNAGRFTKEFKEEFLESEIFDLECQGITYDSNLHYHNSQKYEFKDSQNYITNLKLDI